MSRGPILLLPLAPNLLNSRRGIAPSEWLGSSRTPPDTVFEIASALALAISRAAAAQTGVNVLVVINHASSASETIGRQYGSGAASPNTICVPLPLDESVNREVYDAQIEQPIWSCIANRQARDRILYIVMTKDVPIRISGTSGRSGTNASVDSELT